MTITMVKYLSRMKSKNKNLAKLKELCEKRDSIDEVDYRKYSGACRAISNLVWKMDDKNNLILKQGTIAEITKDLLKQSSQEIEYFLKNYAYCYDYKGEVQASYAYCPIELKEYRKQLKEKYDYEAEHE